MSDQTWNRLLGGVTVWALIGLWPILVFLLGAWILWFMFVMTYRAVCLTLYVGRRLL